jgi:hypothetical protein
MILHITIILNKQDEQRTAITKVNEKRLAKKLKKPKGCSVFRRE